jgi:tRNA-dihydrouridine synthase A
MKELFPNLKIIINGGIEEISEVKKLLNSVDGVMLGRKIYSDPAFLLQVDKEIYQEDTRLDFATGMQKYMSYILKLENKKDANRAITHLVQIIRRISHTKDVRKKLLDNVKNGSVELDEIFDGFKEDLSQRAHLQIH